MMLMVPGSQTNLLPTPHFAAPVDNELRCVTCHVLSRVTWPRRVTSSRGPMPPVSHALVGPFIFHSAAAPLCQAENKLYLK